jgi:hypothetical protein
MSDWEDVPLDDAGDWEDVPLAQAPQSEGLGKQLLRSTVNALPAMGGMAGGIVGAGAGMFGGPAAPATVPAGGVVGAGLGYSLGSEAKDLANQYLFGDAPKANIVDQPLQTVGRVAGNVKDGAMYEMGGQVAGKVVGAGVNAVAPHVKAGANKVAGYFDNEADIARRQLIGGTPTQQKAITPGVLKELQGDGAIGLFDDAGSVAKKLEGRMEQSGAGLQSGLKQMDDAGLTVSPEKVLKQYEEKIVEFNQNGNFHEADALQKEMDYFKSKMESMFLGERGLKPSVMENVKRGTQGNINYGPGGDGVPAVAGKKASASLQRQSVEDVAMAHDPALGEKFVADKQLYHKYDPVIEAAQTQADREGKKSLGRFLDPTRTVPEVWKSTVGRPSLKAWSADKIADAVRTSPQSFGKYAGVLQQAAQRGTQGVASTHFILQQTDEGYRQMLQQVADGDNN